MKRILVITGAAALVAAALYWLVLAPADAQKADTHKAGGAHADGRPVPVMVAETVRKEMPVEITTIGRVQPIASVAVRSRIDGVIADVKVQDGQEVKAGDVLFTLDSRALAAAVLQAKATLARDRAQLDNAKREVERLRPLNQRDFVSHQQFDAAQTTAAMLEATIQADQAQLQSAEVELSYTTITAPIDGRLGTINFKLGNSIKANDTTPLVTLNQIRPIYVSFAVPQSNFAAIEEASSKGKVAVEATLQGDAGGPLKGELAYLENEIDATTNTLSLRATFANPRNRLWPGQYVNVAMILGLEPDAVVVPNEAVQAGQSSPFVFVLKPDSTVEVRPVKVDRAIGSETVIAKGVAPGDKVVVNGQLRLDDGTRVTVQPPSSGATPKEPTG